MVCESPFIVGNSLAFEEAPSEPFVELIDLVDAIRDLFNVILKSDELDKMLFTAGVENGVACARVAISGLSDGSGIDDRLVIIMQSVDADHFSITGFRVFHLSVLLGSGGEVGVFVAEDAGMMGVSHQASLAEVVHHIPELRGVVDRILGEEVFIDGSAHGSVDAGVYVVVEPANSKSIQELGSQATGFRILLIGAVQFVPSPVGGFSRGIIEIGGLVECGEIMVAQQRELTSFLDQVDAFHRVGPVSEDVPQADDLINGSLIDIRQDRFKGHEIAVDVTDDRGSHAKLRSINPRGGSNGPTTK